MLLEVLDELDAKCVCRMENKKSLQNSSATKKADEILTFFKNMRFKYQKITPEKAEMVKQVWDLLHAYDPEYEYTFNEDYTLIRKTKKETYKKKKHDQIH